MPCVVLSVVVYLTQCQDVPHLPVLAQQKSQLLDSSILFSAHKEIKEINFSTKQREDEREH